MQFLPNIEEIQYLRFQNVLQQNKTRMVTTPTSPTLLLLLSRFELLGKEVEREFLFHSNAYSLQLSSEIQNISVTLFSVTIAIFVCVYLYINTLMLQ